MKEGNGMPVLDKLMLSLVLSGSEGAVKYPHTYTLDPRLEVKS